METLLETKPIKRSITIEFNGDEEYWKFLKGLWDGNAATVEIAEVLVDYKESDWNSQQYMNWEKKYIKSLKNEQN